MAGNGAALAFLFCLAPGCQWGVLHAAGCFRRASSQSSSAVATGSVPDRPLDTATPAASLPKGCGSETLQRVAKVSLSGRAGPLLSGDRSCRARDVAAAGRRIPLAALALWRPPVGADDPLCLRL